MGVDFYACQICDETFPDCGNYFGCECGAMFCSTKCGKPDTEDENNPTCCLCRKDEATDYVLLKFLLKHVKMTRNQVLEMYRNENGS